MQVSTNYPQMFLCLGTMKVASKEQGYLVTHLLFLPMVGWKFCFTEEFALISLTY